MAKMFGSKMMSSGGKPTCRSGARRRAGRPRCAARACRPGPSRRTPSRPPPRRSGARACAWRRNSASPSFIEIELTIGLPCTHFRPASITLHFELSIMTGTRAMSGSAATRLQERRHRLLRIEHRLVHVDVDHLRAVLHLLARDRERAGVVAGEDQAREGLRAGDVGALADVHEERLLVDVERLEARRGAARRGRCGRPRAARCRAAPRPSPRCARAWCRSSRRRC